jgi:3-hydroxyacyl-[acyl-carrier-protein] dehydratase
MPGVLIVEAMAQAGCVFFYHSLNMHGKKLTYYLGKVDARFSSPVVPGDQLKIEVLPIKFLSKAGFMKAKVYVQDKVVAEAEIGFGIKEG